MSINEIIMRRKKAVIISEKEDIAPTNFSNENLMFAATVSKNMESLGFLPDKELFGQMAANSDLSYEINDIIVPIINNMVGADVEYNPLYPNFPDEVMEMDESLLYANAIVYYLTGSLLLKIDEKDIKDKAYERLINPIHIDKCKRIGCFTEKDIQKTFADLMNSTMPWSEQDKNDIKELSSVYNIKDYMPKYFSCRENMAFTFNILAEQSNMVSAYKMMKSNIVNANDVLRIMNVVNGNGDASLSKICIDKVSRANRKVYLAMLNNCRNTSKDMKKYYSQWIKIGEKIHPGEFKEVYPRANSAFKDMREKDLFKNVKTDNSIFEKAIENNDVDTLKNIFDKAPGLFARSLERLLRSDIDNTVVMDMYKKYSKNMSINQLWQLYSHFDNKLKNYGEDGKMRIFVIKGVPSKTVVKEDTTKVLSYSVYQDIKNMTENALTEKYKNKPQMGKVYVSPEIMKCKIPNGTRDASSSAETLSKGSALPINTKTNLVRGFIWWTNTKSDERVDIDLSATLFDKDFNRLEDVAYYNIRSEYGCGCMSGDITNGGDYNGKGVAEFLDIDLSKAKNAGARYVCFNIYNYTEQKFSELGHAHFGYMERENDKDGQIFEPSTVENKVLLNAPSTACAVCMFDTEAKEMIWMDETGIGSFNRALFNNAFANKTGLSMACYKAVHLEKPDIYDVIRINAKARNGELVETKEEADISFGFNCDIKPTDIDYFEGDLVPENVAEKFQVKIKNEDINNDR